MKHELLLVGEGFIVPNEFHMIPSSPLPPPPPNQVLNSYLFCSHVVVQVPIGSQCVPNSQALYPLSFLP